MKGSAKVRKVARALSRAAFLMALVLAVVGGLLLATPQNAEAYFIPEPCFTCCACITGVTVHGSVFDLLWFLDFCEIGVHESIARTATI